MPPLRFYQVQVPHFILPPHTDVYMTLKQIRLRQKIIPLINDDAFPHWFRVAQLSHDPLPFEPGEVFGMKEIPPSSGLDHLKICQPQAVLKTPPNPQLLCTLDALCSKPPELFTQLTGMTKTTVSFYLAHLPLPQPHKPGRPLRRSLEESLYLWCLHTHAHYTYAQLAQCYQCSITQVYAPIQWVKQHLPSYYRNLQFT